MNFMKNNNKFFIKSNFQPKNIQNDSYSYLEDLSDRTNLKPLKHKIHYSIKLYEVKSLFLMKNKPFLKKKS